jgi:hypothetical protein
MTVTNQVQPIPEPCCTLDISGSDQEQLVKMFKTIGNNTRFEILINQVGDIF